MRETKRGLRFLGDGGGGGGAVVIKFTPSPFYEVQVAVEIFLELYVSTYSLLNKIIGCSWKKVIVGNKSQWVMFMNLSLVSSGVIIC